MTPKKGWVSINTRSLQKKLPLTLEEVDWLIKVAESCTTNEQCITWHRFLSKQRVRVDRDSVHRARLGDAMLMLTEKRKNYPLTKYKPMKVSYY